MLTVKNPKDNTQKDYPLHKGTVTIGSNQIADIRINNKQVDKVHIIMKVQDEVYMIMDNQSENGTYKLNKDGRQLLTSMTAYEYLMTDVNVFQVGGFNLELNFKPKNVPIKELLDEISEEENKSDLSSEDPPKNPFFDPTLIMPEKNHVQKNAPNEAGKVGFNMGDATQIIGDGNGFKMPQKLMDRPKKGVEFQKPGQRTPSVAEISAFDGATQILDVKPFGKQSVNPMFEPTQLLAPPVSSKSNHHNQHNLNSEVDDILSDATQLIPDAFKAPVSKSKLQPMDLYGATQVINQESDVSKNKGKAGVIKQQQQQFNMMDSTLIIPVNNGKKPMAFEPTLIIADNNKKGNQKNIVEDKSEIDKLLDSDEDSPRFGKKLQKQQKKQVDRVTSSVEDIFDVLDGGQPAAKLDKIAEDKASQEDEDMPVRPVQKFKQFKAQEERKGEDGDIDDMLEDKKPEQEQEEPQSQVAARYNKKRKAGEISNSNQDQPPIQPVIAKKRKLQDHSQEPLHSQKSVRGAKIQPKAASSQDDEDQNDEEEQKLPDKKLTILVSGKAKQDKKMLETLKRLGAKVIDDIESKFDILVTDEKLIRNCKLLQAVTLGAQIVSIKWIEESIQKKAFVEIKPAHCIVDKEFEKAHACKFSQLNEKKDKQQLFKDHSFYISANLPGIKRDQMALLITSAGGQTINSDKLKAAANIVILDEKEDKKVLDQLKKGKKGQHVVSMQFVFEAILRQQFDFKKHSLI